jgi:hypothetical protein
VTLVKVCWQVLQCDVAIEGIPLFQGFRPVGVSILPGCEEKRHRNTSLQNRITPAYTYARLSFIQRGERIVIILIRVVILSTHFGSRYMSNALGHSL